MRRSSLRFLFVLMAACLAHLQGAAGHVEVYEFGKTSDGMPVQYYELQSNSGVDVRLSTLGAALIGVDLPDRNGRVADVVFGFENAAGYEGEGNQYFGVTAGRYANRIAKGRFSLAGQDYQLAINNEPNHLHGGPERALSMVVWRAEEFDYESFRGVRFTYTSPDGEEGYPGQLETTVVYSLNDLNELRIDYVARLVDDPTTAENEAKPTVINLTNHAYFNLGGNGSPTINDHVLMINADRYTPVDDTLIPTGELASVEGTPLDFREPTRLGARVEQLTDTATVGYDHNFVLNKRSAGILTLAARLTDPASGRSLTVFTDQPGIQFYGGNFLNGQRGKDGKTYAHRSGCCLETQHFPDSPNQADFPSVVLQPGGLYTHTCIYAFSAGE